MKIMRGVKESSTKENLNWDYSKKNIAYRSEDCEEASIGLHNDQHFKFVKVKMNKLVPLSMSQLKERLKVL